MKHFKQTMIFVLLTALLMTTLTFVSVLTVNAETSEENKVLAHWKFQNDPTCFVGDIDKDELTFIDLSGNGNDMVVATEGNGSQLDIFTWDVGVDNENLQTTDTKTSLKFDNSLAKAQSVDPYPAEESTFSSAYVSGKFLETVDGICFGYLNFQRDRCDHE